jgi:hypothetical protein
MSSAQALNASRVVVVHVNVPPSIRMPASVAVIAFVFEPM